MVAHTLLQQWQHPLELDADDWTTSQLRVALFAAFCLLRQTHNAG